MTEKSDSHALQIEVIHSFSSTKTYCIDILSSIIPKRSISTIPKTDYKVSESLVMVLALKNVFSQTRQLEISINLIFINI